MERRLDGRMSERAVGFWKHIDGRVLPAVPCTSVASAEMACVGTHLVSHGKLYPLGQARVPGPSASQGREQHDGHE
eukprot:15433409-Alexandrium_andersonii.AAC.1